MSNRQVINASPIAAKKLAAAEKVNEYYNFLAAQELHRDSVHAWKRGVAASIIAGGEPPAEFAAEAELRELTPLDLARLIATKPNAMAAREVERQKRLLAIEAVTTPDQLPG